MIITQNNLNTINMQENPQRYVDQIRITNFDMINNRVTKQN